MKPWNRLLALSLLACLLLSSPVFASDSADDSTGRDDSQVYHVYGNVDLVSSMKFQYGSKPTFFVKYVYPQLEIDSDSTSQSESEDTFNGLVMTLIQKEIAAFKQQVIQNQGRAQASALALQKNKLYIDYDTSVIKADDNYLISIRFSMQAFIAGMAHPLHYHRVINFNLDTNEALTLEDVFQPGSDYLDLLSKYSRFLLSRRLSEKQFISDGATPTPEHFKSWNIKPNGLLITFDESQVAPYIYGAQTVLIPYSVLKPLIASDSPIADCIRHRRSCAHSNLLTGGFIDEAVNNSHRFFNPVLGEA